MTHEVVRLLGDREVVLQCLAVTLAAIGLAKAALERTRPPK